MCHPVALVGLSNQPRHFARMRNSSEGSCGTPVSIATESRGDVFCASRQDVARALDAGGVVRQPEAEFQPVVMIQIAVAQVIERANTAEPGRTGSPIRGATDSRLAKPPSSLTRSSMFLPPKSIPLAARAYPAPTVEGAKNPIAIGVPHPLRQSTARLRSAGVWALDSLILELNPSTACASQGLRPHAWP
jgi:hypothetical protein